MNQRKTIIPPSVALPSSLQAPQWYGKSATPQRVASRLAASVLLAGSTLLMLGSHPVLAQTTYYYIGPGGTVSSPVTGT